MDKKVFVEHILEAENLTDELVDKDARWLLDWGTSHLDEVLADAKDENAAWAKVTALMKVMRQINQMVGGKSNANPDELAGELSSLDNLYFQAFGYEPFFVGKDLTLIADRFWLLPDQDAMKFLLGSEP